MKWKKEPKQKNEVEKRDKKTTQIAIVWMSTWA